VPGISRSWWSSNAAQEPFSRENQRTWLNDCSRVLGTEKCPNWTSIGNDRYGELDGNSRLTMTDRLRCPRAGQPGKLASPFGRLLPQFWHWRRATASGEIEGQLSHFSVGFLRIRCMSGLCLLKSAAQNLPRFTRRAPVDTLQSVTHRFHKSSTQRLPSPASAPFSHALYPQAVIQGIRGLAGPMTGFRCTADSGDMSLRNFFSNDRCPDRRRCCRPEGIQGLRATSHWNLKIVY
jgi:hypothetical protein